MAATTTTSTTTTSSPKSPIIPSIQISSRNKSLVSLRESLLEGFLQHNITNRSSSRSTLPPAMEDRFIAPAFVSPHNSSTNLRDHVPRVMEEDHEDPSPRPLKKRKVDLSTMIEATAVPRTEGPATTAAAQAQAQEQKDLRRKALAAKLRAQGISGRMVLKPSVFARSVFCKNRQIRPPSAAAAYDFCEPGRVEQEIHAKHSHDLYGYVRKGTDLEGFKRCVRDLQAAYHGSHKENQEPSPESQSSNPLQPFRCSNRFGESLMHLACRRGRTEMVRFLVEELPGGSPSEMLNVRDDCLKTPLHDACWTPDPNPELVELILKHAPEQVLMEDVRGNTPFDYVRKEDYRLWLRFLWERRSVLGAVPNAGAGRREQQQQ